MDWKRLRERLASLTRYGYRSGARRTRILIPGRQGPMQGVYEKAVLHDSYSFRARFVQRAARLFIQPVLRYVPINDRTFRVTRSLERLAAKGPRSRFVQPVAYELGGVHVESMTHRYGPTSDMAILYFHGGGFFSGGIESHRRVCESLARYSGANVVSVDYVQLPEGTVADSVQDAITAYGALLEMTADPDKIVLAGDSAGGYLAMKVAELATRRGLLAPAGIVLFSPLLSLDPERKDKAVERIHPVADAYLPPKRLPRIRARWNPPGSTIEGFASPLHASSYISSPVFMTAVEDEMLRPEIEAMSLLLADKGVEVETHIWRKQVHAFPVLADVLPEAKHAVRLASAFARIQVGELDAESVEQAVIDKAFTPVADEELGQTVWVDKSAAESFVDGQTLEGEIDVSAAPEVDRTDIDETDDIIDAELIGDRKGSWFPRVS